MFHVEGLGLLTARKIHYGWGGKLYFILCPVFFLNYPVCLPLLWLQLSFPVLPSEILAAAPPCLWLSTSSPPCLDRGNYWLHWTASSSHRFMVWPTSLWRNKATALCSVTETLCTECFLERSFWCNLYGKLVLKFTNVWQWCFIYHENLKMTNDHREATNHETFVEQKVLYIRWKLIFLITFNVVSQLLQRSDSLAA